MATIPPGVDPTKIPAGQPPIGQTIDFHSPHNEATLLYIAVSCVLAAISFIFVVLKLERNRHIDVADASYDFFIRLIQSVVLIPMCGGVSYQPYKCIALFLLFFCHGSAVESSEPCFFLDWKTC